MANFVSNDNATSLMNAINQKKDSKPSTITWAEWIALTDEQREGTHYIITNVPAKFSDKDAVFSIKDQTLTFTNKAATVSDSRITTDTYIFTFYHNQAVAQAAGIECSWTTGTVTFTVDENPSENIVVDILCILPALATPPSEGGGHTIIDSSGTSLPQESGLQFADAFLTDDSVNGRTVVENVKSVASADYPSETEDGMYLIPDGEGAVIHPSSEDSVTVTSTGSDNKKWGDLLLELRNEMDTSKVTEFSYLILKDSLIYPMYRLSDFTFTWVALTGGGQYDIESIRLSSSPNVVENYNGTITNKTNTLITSAQKLTLYYGNKKAVVDLQTTANRCWYDSNKTVKQKIDEIPIIKSDTKTGTTTSSGLLQQIDESWRPIISATVEGGNNYIIELYKGTSYWAGRVIDNNGNIVANTSVSITYYYL